MNTWNNTGDFYVRVQGKNGSFDADRQFTVAGRRAGQPLLGSRRTPTTLADRSPASGVKTLILVRLEPLGRRRPQTALNTVWTHARCPGRRRDRRPERDATSGPRTPRRTRQSGLPLREEPRRRRDQADRRRIPCDEPGSRVRRRRRRRRRDPVLPLPRPRPARQRDAVRAAGPRHHRVAGEPPARLRPERRLPRVERRRSRSTATSSRCRTSRSAVSSRRRRTSTGCSTRTSDRERRGLACVVPRHRATTSSRTPPTGSRGRSGPKLARARTRRAHHESERLAGNGHGRATTPDYARTAGPPTDLRRELLNQRHDLIFLAGHFSANDALAADYRTNVLSTELPTAHGEPRRTRSSSAPAVTRATTSSTATRPERDAAARLGAGVRAEEGDAHRRHRLPVRRHGLPCPQRADLCRVRRSSSAGPVGSSLLRSKQIFLEESPGLSALDEKALLQTTLFGLPMLSVRT